MEWTQDQLRQLAEAYKQKNPTWTPPGHEAPTFQPNTDPGFVAGNAGLDNRLQNAYASLGLQPTYGPDGKVTGWSFGGGAYDQGAQSFGVDHAGNRISDPNSPLYNPYSRAALLQRTFENNKRGNTNSYAARGQLYAGSLVNAQNETAHGYSVDDDSNRRSALSYYKGLIDRATGAADEHRMDRADLTGGAFDRFLSAQADAPPPYYTPTPDPPAQTRPSYLPEGYETWTQARKSKYWYDRRKKRG